MKKSNTAIPLWIKLMRISGVQLFWTFLFAGSVLAHGNAQEMLQKKISIQFDHTDLPSAVIQLSETAKVDITFNSHLFPKRSKVTAHYRDQTLGAILTDLLKPYKIVYLIVDEQIILRKQQAEKTDNWYPDELPVLSEDADIRITGKVTDENASPLPGVNIIVKGISRGTTTDAEGEFSIIVNNNRDVLVFSFVGYVTQEIEVGNKTHFEIRLEQDVKILEETVVVGYGSVLKSDLTGSVGTVNITEMAKAPVSSFADALAGRVAGLQVSFGDGQPGRNPTILIRGISSLTQRVAPLFVVDGFPIDNLDMSSIAPEDIESISVLKDASSTAIYGSRAGNGVILINTKRGKEGKPVINLSNSTGFQMDGKRIEVMGPYEFVRYISELHPSANYVKNYFENDRTLDYYKTAEGIDWQDEVFRTGSFQKNSISVRGGTPQTKYSFSGSFFNQNGVIINTGMKRQTANFTLDQDIGKRLKGGIAMYYSGLSSFGQVISSQSASAVSSYLMFRTWGYRPITSPRENLMDLLTSALDQASLTNSDFRLNPKIDLENQYNYQWNHTFQGNSYLNLDLMKGLTLRMSGGIRGAFYKNDQFYNTNTIQASPANIYNANGVHGYIFHNFYNSWSNENTLSYKKIFDNNHTLTALGIFSLYKNTYQGDGFGGRLLPNEQLKMDGLDQSTAFAPSSSTTRNSLVSYAFRVDYGIQSKYLLTLNFRADGSSKFKDPWGYFPGAAIAWNMHKEQFFEGLQSVVSGSKFRASFGVNGNNWVGDFSRFPSLSQSINGYSFGNQSPGAAAYISNIGNPALRWEKVTTFDIGYELGLFQDRVQLEVDLYHKKTTDLLLNAPLPRSTGFSSAFQNVGSMSNRGLEISIRTVNIEKRDFSWQSSFNISFNQNKILSLAQNQQKILSHVSFEPNFGSALYVSEIGRPAGMIIGYIWDGNYQFEDFNNPAPETYLLKPDVPSNGAPRNSIRPGDIKYKDLNGDGVVNGFDRTIIGRGQPIHIGGFSNNIIYKRFTLNAFFQWSYGNDLYNANRITFEGNSEGYWNLNQFASYADRWTPENPTNKNFRAGGQGPEGMHSSRVVENGSFLRLKTVSLAYTLSDPFLDALKIKKMEINLAAQNLITFTKYTGLDPEVSTRGSVLTPGFDYSSYPLVPTVVMGISLDF